MKILLGQFTVFNFMSTYWTLRMIFRFLTGYTKLSAIKKWKSLENWNLYQNTWLLRPFKGPNIYSLEVQIGVNIYTYVCRYTLEALIHLMELQHTFIISAYFLRVMGTGEPTRQAKSRRQLSVIDNWQARCVTQREWTIDF